MRFTSIVPAFVLGLTVTSAATIPARDTTALSVDASEVGVNGTELSIDKTTYKVVFGTGAPSGGSTCPASNNGNFGNYPLHKYTQNQLEAAFKAGANNQGNGKQIGANDYPHAYGNSEKFKFSCSGSSFEEFPIQTTGKTYTGGDVKTVPDRVIYSYKIKGSTLTANYCGTIRHGPQQDFIQCSA